MRSRLLVIDNYDSFTFNLVQMFLQYDLDIWVFRSDKLALNQVSTLAPNYLLVSPGPKDPAHAGISIPIIREWHRQIPILGVCLGMQCINEVFQGRTVRAPIPRHGKVSAVHHDGQALFTGLPSPFTAARYHSLMVEVHAGALAVTARSDDGVIMGLSHPEFPLHGVQFHPESFMTETGFELIENFLRIGPLATPVRQAPRTVSPLTIH
ncbi:MAG: aminodeoxychorismate/anthranilate synthase component II [Desulfobacteraceae bacterium]|nr:aminodeoxychorismate/anthranilate synthase component II [Desulfobacteraceae bacterium]MBC2753043.1 aminodeoxychorismate/anthranilate synthase component II [Desulfobacteraceae bacterium]